MAEIYHAGECSFRDENDQENILCIRWKNFYKSSHNKPCHYWDDKTNHRSFHSSFCLVNSRAVTSNSRCKLHLDRVINKCYDRYTSGNSQQEFYERNYCERNIIQGNLSISEILRIKTKNIVSSGINKIPCCWRSWDKCIKKSKRTHKYGKQDEKSHGKF